MKAQVERLDLNGKFFFLGFRPDGLSIIAGLDILVVPSVILEVDGQPLSEGFGRVAAEAMGVGTPVIVSDVGGLPEVVGTENAGLLVPPANAQALAETVTDLCQNLPLQKSLVVAGKSRFERCFTINRHVEAITNFYASIFQAPPNHRD
ncbi:MAG: glycosyltransferase family 4 protein [bacterium]|nr:glycosyltransferase family 4 protein [bacterium]